MLGTEPNIIVSMECRVSAGCKLRLQWRKSIRRFWMKLSLSFVKRYYLFDFLALFVVE